MRSSHRIAVLFACISVLGLCQVDVRAEVPAPPPGDTNRVQLSSWSFTQTNWQSDIGYPPLAWTNITAVPGGLGKALLLDSTNRAFLAYRRS